VKTELRYPVEAPYGQKKFFQYIWKVVSLDGEYRWNFEWKCRFQIYGKDAYSKDNFDVCADYKSGDLITFSKHLMAKKENRYQARVLSCVPCRLRDITARQCIKEGVLGKMPLPLEQLPEEMQLQYKKVAYNRFRDYYKKKYSWNRDEWCWVLEVELIR
jgi:hypothetical protein